MLLRRKTFLLMLTILAALLVLLYVVLRIIMLNGFSAAEQQGALRNVARALNSFRDSADNLGQSIQDWSSWDDTYQFVSDHNDDYIQTNLQDATVLSLGINLM